MAATPDFSLPDGFHGPVRLFPLPNLVLFPHMLQPLHIFEPRYQALMQEALVGDRLIAMALLRPGWEQDYEGRPPLYPFACLGRLVTHEPLADGKYNLLLAGLKRLEVIRELPPAKLFREAEVAVREDHYSAKNAAHRQSLHDELVEVLRQIVSKLPQAEESLEQLLARRTPLGMLTDLVASTLNLDCAFKQQLLAELDVDRRARLLLEQIATPAAQPAAGLTARREFPPGFSVN